METKHRINPRVKEYHPNDFTFDPLRSLDGIEDTESFRELVSSLQGRLDAKLPPIVEPCSFWMNTDGQRVLFSGHRRVLAAKIVGCDVPAFEKQPPDKIERLAGKLISNMQREDLSPLDLARAFSELANEEGYKVIDIAAMIGKSKGLVSQTLALLKLTPQIKEAVHDGRLSAKAGYAASRIPEQDQVEFADAIIASKTATGVKSRAAALKRMHEMEQPAQQAGNIEADTNEVIPETAPDEEYTQCFMLLNEARNLIKQAIDLADTHKLEVSEEMSSVLELVKRFFDEDEGPEEVEDAG